MRALLGTIFSSLNELVTEVATMPLPYLRTIHKVGDALELEADIIIAERKKELV